MRGSAPHRVAWQHRSGAGRTDRLRGFLPCGAGGRAGQDRQQLHSIGAAQPGAGVPAGAGLVIAVRAFGDVVQGRGVGVEDRVEEPTGFPSLALSSVTSAAQRGATALVPPMGMALPSTKML